ncbi:FAD binding domain-containing protein [Pseudorhizobium flavum]|uniref:FAD binding domain-containing protein n=1 Tax=Pseudorhizobium flavum TaxID=1335061 RepID=UPI002493344B|nr:FAD binding domain-containing protein [Pseudorhizobium flavum]
MAKVEWIIPASIDEAVQLLATPGHQAVAGGTTVSDLMRLGHRMGPSLVDISRLALAEISETHGVIRIGALCSNTQVARSSLIADKIPALSQAILSGASEQIRNAASIGGNLKQAPRCVYFREPSFPCNLRAAHSGCSASTVPTPSHAILGVTPACLATHPSDMAVALAALDAVVIGQSARGFHCVALRDFYRTPGEAEHPLTGMPEDALITAVELATPDISPVSGYLKLRGRASYEFASASVAAHLGMKDGVVNQIGIAFGGVATKPWRNREAERMLIGGRASAAEIDRFLDRVLSEADLREVTAYKAPLLRGATHHIIERLAARW